MLPVGVLPKEESHILIGEALPVVRVGRGSVEGDASPILHYIDLLDLDGRARDGSGIQLSLIKDSGLVGLPLCVVILEKQEGVLATCAECFSLYVEQGAKVGAGLVVG